MAQRNVFKTLSPPYTPAKKEYSEKEGETDNQNIPHIVGPGGGPRVSRCPKCLPPLNSEASGTQHTIQQPAGDPNPSASNKPWLLFF